MSRKYLAAWMAALIALVFVGCAKESKETISLETTRQPEASQPADQKLLRFAVGGMITPKEGMAFYRDFLRYAQEKIGVRVEYVDRQDYGEINDMLRSRQLEAAFVCSGPYVDGQKQFGLELLAAPQAYGKTVYYSYIIVPKASPANSFEDLRGKRFAFTDPLSNTGKLVPTYMLALKKETPESFFGNYVFTSAHDLSIKAVAQQVVDGAAVDSLIWDYLNATNPEFTSQTRILEKSSPYAIPPVVVPQGLDAKLKEQLREVFLTAHEDPKGKELLKKMMIDRFVPIEDGAYDSIREMKSWLASQPSGK